MHRNGDAWFHGMGQWLRAHWYVILLAIGVLGWVIRVEVFAQAGARFTPQDAQILEQKWEDRFDALPPDTYEQYIDQRFDALEDKIDILHADILWLRQYVESP